VTDPETEYVQHYKHDQRPRPKSPKAPAFAALRKRLGIPEDAVTVAELDPIVGPVVQVAVRFHDEVACPGSFRVVEEGDAIWTAFCDGCRAEVTGPVSQLDPEVTQRMRLDRAGVPDRFVGARFVEDPENRSALAAIRQWMGSRDTGGKRKELLSSLLPAPALWGDAGRGKSHLLTAVCVRLVNDCDVTVLYRSARHLLRELQRFEDPLGCEQAWERATTVDVLALDDLGAQQGTEWKLDQLADLIDERYARELPIVVATNYPPAAWELRLDARTHSRLHGMTFPLELRGPDRRQPQLEETA
jgi:chromosomal replication initiation ATPase DnaA